MKRRLIIALGLQLLLAMVGCDRSQPVTSTTENKPAASAPANNSTAATSAATATPPAESADALASTTEQVTETDGAESADSAASNSLALRISEMKPEPTSQWKEGVHFMRLVPAQPTGAAPGQVEVTEVFWYGCPHCFALDPTLETWRKNGKPAYVSFVRVPVMWGPVHHTHARLFYTAELLGKLDELHSQIFQEIHQHNNPLTSVASIETFFAAHGISQADFQKAFSSFAVEASLKRAEELGLRYKVDSVPLIVINGKYVTDVGRAGSPQQLLALINDLASREHGT